MRSWTRPPPSDPRVRAPEASHSRRSIQLGSRPLSPPSAPEQESISGSSSPCSVPVHLQPKELPCPGAAPWKAAVTSFIRDLLDHRIWRLRSTFPRRLPAPTSRARPRRMASPLLPLLEQELAMAKGPRLRSPARGGPGRNGSPARPATPSSFCFRRQPRPSIAMAGGRFVPRCEQPLSKPESSYFS